MFAVIFIIELLEKEIFLYVYYKQRKRGNFRADGRLLSYKNRYHFLRNEIEYF